MEFAFLNAILKSPYFPPYDPYFAGGYINYYYYGIYLVGILTKLTGTLPEVAFNLAIPTLFALTVVNAFSVAFNIASFSGKTAGRLDKRAHGRDFPAPRSCRVCWPRCSLPRWATSTAGCRLSRGSGRRTGGEFHSGIIGVDGLAKIVQGTLALFSGGKSLPAFDYWRSSRVIPFTINEFPLWSFLFADLHPHMIGIPFTLLAIGLAAHQLLRPRVEHVAAAATGHELDGTGELTMPLAPDPLHTRTMAVYAHGASVETGGDSLSTRIASWFALALTLGR